MRIVVIGAGRSGASFGARLAQAGNEVTLVDAWAAHVEAIQRAWPAGAGRAGAGRDPRCRRRLPADAPAGRIWRWWRSTPTTPAGRGTVAAALLVRGRRALTLQNGIGNVETLTAELGRQRVVGGSTMCSFRTVGARRGRADQRRQDHRAASSTARTAGGSRALRDLLRGAGYPTEISTDIMAAIWEKLIVNVTINPICGITGLRMGELARLPATDRYPGPAARARRWRSARAKGLELPEADLREQIKAHCWDKYSKPSMLQHLEAGRRTEIAALNGALVREAAGTGCAGPVQRGDRAADRRPPAARAAAVATSPTSTMPRSRPQPPGSRDHDRRTAAASPSAAVRRHRQPSCCGHIRRRRPAGSSTPCRGAAPWTAAIKPLAPEVPAMRRFVGLCADLLVRPERQSGAARGRVDGRARRRDRGGAARASPARAWRAISSPAWLATVGPPPSSRTAWCATATASWPWACRYSAAASRPTAACAAGPGTVGPAGHRRRRAGSHRRPCPAATPTVWWWCRGCGWRRSARSSRRWPMPSVRPRPRSRPARRRRPRSWSCWHPAGCGGSTD